MLGSSEGGLQFAVEKGLGLAFATHLAPHLAISILRSYRKDFRPSVYMKEPKSILAIGVIVGETEEEAKYLADPAELSWARMSTGSSNLSLPTLEEAKTVEETVENMRREVRIARIITSNPIGINIIPTVAGFDLYTQPMLDMMVEEGVEAAVMVGAFSKE